MLINHIIWEYFLPYCGLSVHFGFSIISYGTFWQLSLSLSLSLSPYIYIYIYIYIYSQSLSCVQLFATPWTGAPQTPLSMWCFRLGYPSGLPFPSPVFTLNQCYCHQCESSVSENPHSTFHYLKKKKKKAHARLLERKNKAISSIWSRKWQPTPIFLPGASHGQRSLGGYSPWGQKESFRTEQLTMCMCVCVCVCVHTYNWITLLHTWNYHIITALHFSKKNFW